MRSPFGSAASHGGRTSLTLFTEIFYNTNLFDVLKHREYLFVDAGSSIGQNVVLAGLINTGAPSLSIGVKVDNDRHESAL